jgi:NAD(P)-dependent dehydrogenase (short-subunit alcohol dehydrogenase family)
MPQAAHDRWVSTREVGDVIAFLLSEAGSGVNGAVIPVYGRV